jgi:acyl-CoA thioesterase FadM
MFLYADFRDSLVMWGVNMNLYIRLLVAVIKGMLGRKLHLLDKGITYYRVMPWDLDAYGHMNNGRYLQISDVARIELMCRTNAAKIIFKKRWGGVLGGSLVRHSRALKLFTRYKVISRVLCWDDRWFFTEHRFESLTGQVVTVCITRAALRNRKDWAGTKDIVNSVAPGLESPAITSQIKHWLAADLAMSATPVALSTNESANDANHSIPISVANIHH